MRLKSRRNIARRLIERVEQNEKTEVFLILPQISQLLTLKKTSNTQN